MRLMRLTLREALASDRLDAFVRKEASRGVELAKVLILSERSPCSSHSAD
jgi:hypothetical protein